ncbi:MAG TPA: TatD family hydrolase [Bacteroidia bacterium]|nr:TatD family hydrolase [Bacteroidia bacterium]
MILTDTHAHLYSDKFSAGRDEMMQRAISSGVERIFLPAIDSESHNDLHKMADAYPGICFPMMGLHPTSVDKATAEKELALVESLHGQRRYYAVGEIGIDLYWDKTQLSLQQEVFARQVELAKKLQLPVVIHSRNAFVECYEIVKDKQDGTLKGVFHCFSDGLPEAEKVIALGNFWMGIGGVLTYKNSGLDKVVQAFDTKYFVLETDAPYLAPAPHRGKRNESSYLILVAQKMAELKNCTVEEIAEITTDNSYLLFGI